MLSYVQSSERVNPRALSRLSQCEISRPDTSTFFQITWARFKYASPISARFSICLHHCFDKFIFRQFISFVLQTFTTLFDCNILLLRLRLVRLYKYRNLTSVSIVSSTKVICSRGTPVCIQYIVVRGKLVILRHIICTRNICIHISHLPSQSFQ